MEALRRLRRNSNEMNVDRRLVTNVILSFLSTPRADSKRFEMLSLLASILSWNDQEREKAGLQRIHPSEAPQTTSFWARSSSASSPAKAMSDLEKSDETEVCITSKVCKKLILMHRLICSLFLDYGLSSSLQKPQLENLQPMPRLPLRVAA